MEYLINTAVGTLLGFLAGLGTGGGSLLILWLTVVQEELYDTARNMNLLFFLPGAVAASFLRGKQGSVPFRKILPAIISGCAAAALFSFLGKETELSLMRKLFGVLLLFTGARELLYKPGNQRFLKER